jgi:hypothetical protein
VADVAARRARDDEGMEIQICLDRTEPPAGRLRRVPESGLAPRGHDGERIGFVGWLGMLRALDEVIGAPEDRAPEAG